MAEVMKKANKPKKAVAKPIQTTDKVKMVATEAHPHIVEGEIYEVHPEVARKNIRQGYADKDKGTEALKVYDEKRAAHLEQVKAEQEEAKMNS